MFFYEGYSCPVCEKPFTETDDIVTCPACGAPHHRACWQQEGHCHFESDHGTERQWQKPAAKAPDKPEDAAEKTAKTCPHCGAENPGFAEFCSRCGQSLPFREWSRPAGHVPPPPFGGQPPHGPGMPNEYAPYHMPTMDPLGGVPKEEEIEGVRAEELALCVAANTHYYIPRFQKMAKKQKTSLKTIWNWPAFLIPPYWLLYRKQYLTGGIALVFWAVINMLRQFAYVGMYEAAGSWSVPALAEAMNSGRVGTELWILFLTLCAELLLRVIFGLTANRLYMRLCVRRTKKLRDSNPAGYRMELPRVGGISFAFGMLAYMLLWMSSIFYI